MEVRAVPVLDEHGRIREWVGAHTDITDRVQAEEQLSQAQRLQAVGTLAGGVAHEVNNQLMAVLGFGDFVLGALGPAHAQAADVREMVSAATRAARVAQQLLTFSRRQVKQTSLLDPHAAVTALVPVLERLLGADKTLVVLPNRARCRVMADPTQIDQVLINLAANARDAMRTGGRLTIGIDDVVLDERIRRGARGEPSRARTVRPHHRVGHRIRHEQGDAGEDLRALLHHQAGRRRHRTRPLDGIRHREAARRVHLAVQRARRRDHDEDLSPRRTGGRRASRCRRSPSRPPSPPPEMDTSLVLVVEDETAIRELVRRTLEGAGLVVIEAENGRQALDIFALGGEPPKLVLTDVIMPELNGRELSDALADLHPTLPVLFMSGYTGDDVLARSLLPETAPFIQKPFAPEELLARVRAMLAGAPTSEVR